MDKRIASLMGLSRPTFERQAKAAREALTAEMVPRHLGISRMTRDILRSHLTTVAEELFCDGGKVAVVADGTYTYIQKSSNYAFQRSSYSGHKHRPLLKPFMICAPDGYIIDVFGQFTANINDATIVKHISTEIMKVLREGDVFLADRGFRDAVAHLTALGLDVRLPEPQSGSHPSVEQANRTRLVTKCRFIVEVRNGHLKQCFRHFDKVWHNHSVPHMMEEFRIACDQPASESSFRVSSLW
jgi:hypothetical protein